MDKDGIGPLGEKAAALYLEDNGWTVIARNVSTAHGELDIIAEMLIRRGDGCFRRIIFVEVKTRRYRRGTPPSTNVTYKKRRKIISLARWFLKTNRIRNASLRFDVIGITWKDGPQHIKHIQGAFDSSARL